MCNAFENPVNALVIAFHPVFFFFLFFVYADVWPLVISAKKLPAKDRPQTIEFSSPHHELVECSK